MTVVTPTDCPKSVRNCCEIEVFGGVFMLSIDFRIFFWYRGFSHKTKSDLILFLVKINKYKWGKIQFRMDYAELQGTESKRKLRNENILPTVGFQHNLQIRGPVDALPTTQLVWSLKIFKVNFINTSYI